MRYSSHKDIGDTYLRELLRFQSLKSTHVLEVLCTDGSTECFLHFFHLLDHLGPLLLHRLLHRLYLSPEPLLRLLSVLIGLGKLLDLTVFDIQMRPQLLALLSHR
jgi:hypothetical protein